MNGYVIVTSTVLDTDKLKQYGQAAGATVKAYGGVFIVKSLIENLAGQSLHTNCAVIQFADIATAKAWYFSDEYQRLIPIRDQAMNCDFNLVEGH